MEAQSSLRVYFGSGHVNIAKIANFASINSHNFFSGFFALYETNYFRDLSSMSKGCAQLMEKTGSLWTSTPTDTKAMPRAWYQDTADIIYEIYIFLRC